MTLPLLESLLSELEAYELEVQSGDTSSDSVLPIFHFEREFLLHKLMGRELVENIVKQKVQWYKISPKATESNFYGESKKKVWSGPYTLYARVSIVDEDVSLEGGVRRQSKGSLTMHVYNDHVSSYGVGKVRVGDFLSYNGKFYEVVDHGPADSENKFLLGLEYPFYTTIRARFINRDVFEGK